MGDDHVYVHRIQSGRQTSMVGFLSQTETRNHPLARILSVNGMVIPQVREIYSLMRSPKELNAVTGKTENCIYRQRCSASRKDTRMARALYLQ